MEQSELFKLGHTSEKRGLFSLNTGNSVVPSLAYPNSYRVGTGDNLTMKTPENKY